ncbi:MFS transporter, partial [Klebsiella pneumoniae]|uniref:MFS transporter n=1 Tax=Klebsiella pneumoniae TaxID=573 RepID=UPI003852014C
MTDAFAAQLSFLLVGLWWIGFAQITFATLPKSMPALQRSQNNIFTNGFYELKKVWKEATHLPVLKRFLLSFFFY